MKARNKCIKDKKQIWKTSLKGTRQRKRLRKAKIKIVKPRTFRFEDVWSGERSGIKAKTGRLEHGSYRKMTVVIPFLPCLPEVTQSKAVEVKGRVERSKNQDQSTTTQATSKCYFDQPVLPLAVSCGQVLLPAVFWQSWWLPSIPASQHMKHANEGHTKMKRTWKPTRRNTWPREVFGSWFSSSRLVAAT